MRRKQAGRRALTIVQRQWMWMARVQRLIYKKGTRKRRMLTTKRTRRRWATAIRVKVRQMPSPLLKLKLRKVGTKAMVLGMMTVLGMMIRKTPVQGRMATKTTRRTSSLRRTTSPMKTRLQRMKPNGVPVMEIRKLRVVTTARRMKDLTRTAAQRKGAVKRALNVRTMTKKQTTRKSRNPRLVCIPLQRLQPNQKTLKNRKRRIRKTRRKRKPATPAMRPATKVATWTKTLRKKTPQSTIPTSRTMRPPARPTRMQPRRPTRQKTASRMASRKAATVRKSILTLMIPGQMEPPANKINLKKKT
ncbi:hypothetical protein DFJ73DRAFT_816549, partial [Zopfochytrium polystomum]